MTPGHKPRILISDPLTPDGIEILQNGGKFEVVNEPTITPEKLAEVIGGFDALAIRSRTNVTADILKNSGNLKVIGRAGVGLDNVDIAAATERGIIVMNTPEGNTLSTAEHTCSMMLSLVRKIAQADRLMKQGEWPKKSLTGVELYGKTLGVLGLGKIGREVAKRMKSFGMEILGFDPFVNASAAEKMGIKLGEVDEICAQADIITVHTPLNKDTKGLIDARRIAMMKPGILLVNCARGGIMDESALLEGLRIGKIAGAALDVFESEPLPKDHPFRSLENIVMTPHLAASTTEAQEKVTRDVAQQIVEFLEGGMIRNAVNAPSLDPRELDRLKPVLNLAERIGKFVSQYCSNPVTRLEVRYSGTAAEYPLAPLTTAAVKGYLSPHGDVAVNFVNAMYLAKSRGIEVVESSSSDSFDYAGLITVAAESANGERNSISGTLFHSRFPSLVIINGKHLNVTPQGNLIVIQNNDVPGIVGSVGTLLGNAKINIADMTWGRNTPGGEAITVLNVDSDVSPEVVEGLKALPNILSVKVIEI
ncbi:phosphoglycerate dehydrogenase [Candidatus Sumerlaeota bacterium]|nr:phosphoglycerate dehydrogenase [Candidatus Sumerlaeota bacterium]MBI3737081.1 phosphoglycerate dehydrogenase [Candidatus Sumerlaeota bacterium]